MPAAKLSDFNKARPSAVIAFLKQENAELEAYCATLKGALIAYGIDAVPQRNGILTKLTAQEAALVGILYSAYPRYVDRYSVLEALPGRDHAEDRGVGLVACRVTWVRKALGEDAILTQRGDGYRLGDALYQILKEEKKAALTA